MSESKALRIGIAGLGTVGSSVVRLLQAQGALLADRCGKNLQVTAVSARDKSKPRDIDLSGVSWRDDSLELARDSSIDVVVELIGGSDGAAKALVEQSLRAGKHVVTANKALLAHHGGAIGRLAAQSGRHLGYEAAVAGGIPIIKGVREGLVANRISAVFGILNGTCNYILTEMRATGRDFAAVLAEAQAKGYAEADPAFDVDGIDAGHKLAILAALAFGHEPDFAAVQIEGIRAITPMDIAYAAELGYRIKLLGIARRTDKGIEQSVAPCMVPADAPIAAVDGVLNAVYVDGDFVKQALFVGRGAGGDPTASAVVADLVDIARGHAPQVWGVRPDSMKKMQVASAQDRIGPYYLRLMVLDQPGVIADVANILRDRGISLESMLQHGRSAKPDQPVPVILTMHDAREADMRKALEAIAGLKTVAEPPRLIRIESFS